MDGTCNRDLTYYVDEVSGFYEAHCSLSPPNPMSQRSDPRITTAAPVCNLRLKALVKLFGGHLTLRNVLAAENTASVVGCSVYLLRLHGRITIHPLDLAIHRWLGLTIRRRRPGLYLPRVHARLPVILVWGHPMASKIVVGWTHRMR